MRLLCNNCEEWIKLRDLNEKYVMIGDYKIKYYHCKKCDEALYEFTKLTIKEKTNEQ